MVLNVDFLVLSTSDQLPRGTSTFREFSKRGNEHVAPCQVGLFRIRDSELATDLSGQQIGNLCVAWYCGDPARVRQIYILAVLPSFLGKNTIKSLQVPDQFPPFHLHLELLDHHFTLRKSR